MSEPIIFGQPQLGDEEIDLVVRTLRSTWIGQGPLVAEFERRLADEVWAEHAVAVSSCTAALELALLALGVGAGDEVITTPLTFVATVNAIEAVGATPVLVDIDPQTLVLTPQTVAAHVTERTRVVLPVSFGGRPLAIDGFLALADRLDLHIVEDAAHSIGAVADGMPVGATRHPRLLTCFSFYPNKNLASAEGGAITILRRGGRPLNCSRSASTDSTPTPGIDSVTGASSPRWRPPRAARRTGRTSRRRSRCRSWPSSKASSPLVSGSPSATTRCSPASDDVEADRPARPQRPPASRPAPVPGPRAGSRSRPGRAGSACRRYRRRRALPGDPPTSVPRPSGPRRTSVMPSWRRRSSSRSPCTRGCRNVTSGVCANSWSVRSVPTQRRKCHGEVRAATADVCSEHSAFSLR